MFLVLVNRRNSALFQLSNTYSRDNTLEVHLCLRYEILAQSLYSTDNWRRANNFFKHLDFLFFFFLSQESFPREENADIAFKHFLVSRHLRFYRKSKSKPETRWQKCVNVQVSYFDRFQFCLNTLNTE